MRNSYDETYMSWDVFVVEIKSSRGLFFFFFQAEDGIRDRNVTGVQTCALPILLHYTKELFVRIVRLRNRKISLNHSSTLFIKNCNPTLKKYEIGNCKE